MRQGVGHGGGTGVFFCGRNWKVFKSRWEGCCAGRGRGATGSQGASPEEAGTLFSPHSSPVLRCWSLPTFPPPWCPRRSRPGNLRADESGRSGDFILGHSSEAGGPRLPLDGPPARPPPLPLPAIKVTLSLGPWASRHLPQPRAPACSQQPPSGGFHPNRVCWKALCPQFPEHADLRQRLE